MESLSLRLTGTLSALRLLLISFGSQDGIYSLSELLQQSIGAHVSLKLKDGDGKEVNAKFARTQRARCEQVEGQVIGLDNGAPVVASSAVPAAPSLLAPVRRHCFVCSTEFDLFCSLPRRVCVRRRVLRQFRARSKRTHVSRNRALRSNETDVYPAQMTRRPRL